MTVAAVTAEQITGWKKQFPLGVYKLALSTGEVVYVRQPTTAEIEYASMNLMQGKTYTFGITLLNVCRLGGDTIATEDEAKLRGLAQQMQQIIEVVATTVEKL